MITDTYKNGAGIVITRFCKGPLCHSENAKSRGKCPFFEHKRAGVAEILGPIGEQA